VTAIEVVRESVEDIVHGRHIPDLVHHIPDLDQGVITVIVAKVVDMEIVIIKKQGQVLVHDLKAIGRIIVRGDKSVTTNGRKPTKVTVRRRLRRGSVIRRKTTPANAATPMPVMKYL
jgi:hypothetical protein